MIYIFIIIIVLILAYVFGSKSEAKLREEQKKIRDAVIIEGEKAGEEGRGERTCPYDDGPDPGNVPIGVALFSDDGTDKGKRYWWMSSYRTAYRRREALRRERGETSRHASVTSNPVSNISGDPWFEEAINRLVSIYIDHPNHDSQGLEPKRELERIGAMFNERGGMKLMRAAHAEFTRRCNARNVRDRSGYISAPRSLEYRWNGIGAWMS